MKLEQAHGGRNSIDFFLRSLAASHHLGFAVVLSGAGSDGIVGLQAVKGEGGSILVQDPNQAEESSLPAAALGTGLADAVLPVRELAQCLANLARGRKRRRP